MSPSVATTRTSSRLGTSERSSRMETGYSAASNTGAWSFTSMMLMVKLASAVLELSFLSTATRVNCTVSASSASRAALLSCVDWMLRVPWARMLLGITLKYSVKLSFLKLMRAWLFLVSVSASVTMISGENTKISPMVALSLTWAV